MKETYSINNSTIRALIVEDARINAIVLEHSLKTFDVECFWVSNSKEALKALEENEYHIVFLDHYLTTEHSGILLNTIKESYENLPVIAYTGSIYTLGNIRSFLNVFPYDDIITKPFVPTHVERVLRERFDYKLKILE